MPNHLYDAARNHLMLQIVLANCQRAWAMGNITVESILKAREETTDEGEQLWTFLVSEHKTTSAHGTAVLGADRETYQLLISYVQNIR